MTEKDSDFDISRRKALAGLSTIGIASAGAGLGTTAYLNDTESFEDNSLTAGTVDLVVTADLVYTNRDDSAAPSTIDLTENQARFEADGTTPIFLTIEDVKPGDRYIFQMDYEIKGNPSYLKIDTEEIDDNENVTNNPSGVSGLQDDADGELDDLLGTRIFSTASDITGPGDLSAGSVTTFDNNQIATSGAGEMGATYNNSSVGPNPTLNGVLNENLNPDSSYGDDPNGGLASQKIEGLVIQDSTGEAESLSTGTYKFAWDLNFPDTVGNEVQADSVTFGIGGTVEQARNNPEPFV